MKKIFSILIVLFTSTSIYSQVNDLTLQGIIDFDLISAGYTGKAIHLVANNYIPDLSIYGIGVANNASGGDGQEYSFPQMAMNAGDHLLLARDSSAMSIYFDVCFTEFDYVLPASNAISQNGNDAIELFKDSIVIETFGDINVDGTGTGWEYLDSWAYKDPSGSITLESDFNIENITIHDALGKQIKDFNFENNKLNVIGFSKGIFIISTTNKGHKIQKKFIKF